MADRRWQRRNRLRRELLPLLALLLGVAMFTVGIGARLVGARHGDLVVGAVEDRRTAFPAPALEGSLLGLPGAVAVAPDDGAGILAPGARPRPAPSSGHRLLDPSGRPYGAPIPFNADIPVPPGLVWVLLVGSDARAGEPLLRTRADSIHLLAANPETGQATIVGFPRDSYVEIPDHGPGKINTALGLGGPELLARTVNRFTGLPVQYWVVAGFEAFKGVVDAVGGVDVEVTRRMDDDDSGAHFNPGYHHFDGEQALAFSRDRHEFADGDLSRSRNQGTVVLAALAKLRSEVGDELGLRRWLGLAFRHLTLDVNAEQALQLLAVARRTDPTDVTNLVLPGQGGMVGAQSVVYLDPAAAALVADDIRPDAAVGPARQPVTTSSTISTTTSTTTTGQPPSSSPSAAPPPAPRIAS